MVPVSGGGNAVRIRRRPPPIVLIIVGSTTITITITITTTYSYYTPFQTYNCTRIVHIDIDIDFLTNVENFDLGPCEDFPKW